MIVNFNPNLKFTGNTQPPLNPVTNSIYTPVQQPEKPVKKPSKFVNGISKIAKFFTSLGEMTKATVKALVYGTATAAASLLAFWTVGTLPKAIKKGTDLTLKEAFKHPIKNISKTGKVLTTVAALGVATVHVIKGILNMNQRTANVDHKLKTGHRS